MDNYTIKEGKTIIIASHILDEVEKVCSHVAILKSGQIVANGKVGFFKNKIDHYSYKSYDHYISKMNHYGQLRGQQFFEEGRTVNLFHILIKPPARFFIHYFVRLGFLDGFPGFIFAKTQA